MLMLVDHALNLIAFEPADWRFLGTAGANREWLIFRRNDGWWAKGKRGGSLYHFQSIHQVWELYIQASLAPPIELRQDTEEDRRKTICPRPLVEPVSSAPTTTTTASKSPPSAPPAPKRRKPRKRK